MNRLSGKVAIVTGAGRGIGRGIAIRFAAEGAKVIVASRTQATVQAVVDEIKNAGGEAAGVACDVGHEEQIKAMIAQTVNIFGTVDILVNNAHSFGTPDAPTSYARLQPFEEISDAEWEYTMRTGLMGTIWCMRAAFPYMKARGGKIINIGSGSGQRGTRGRTAYNVSKEAIRALTRTVAREWGRHQIMVNVINPLAYSHMMDKAGSAHPLKIDLAKAAPLGRVGDPVRDIGGVALFLASSDSDYVTGATIAADGGSLMWS